MKIAVKVLKMIGIAILVIIVLLAILIFRIFTAPMVPKDYTKTAETGGEIEAAYMAAGQYQVKHIEAETPGDWKKFVAYYPADLEETESTFPVVVFVNGTGVGASKYKALFQHLASWGFIVLGNEDPSTCTGASADATLTYLLEENDNPDSVFYQKVDLDHIGISGHSQGGVGVFNAVNEQEHSDMYTCAVSISPTEWALACAIGMTYEPSKTDIPTMILAGTENDVISPEGAMVLFDAVTSDKVVALRAGVDHGQMLYCADGYVTAWFMWQLQGDQDAAKAFIGENPEILDNAMYQNILINLN